MKLNKRNLALVAGLFAVTFAMAGCGQVKVGYVDGSRVVDEAPQLKAVLDEGNQKLEEAAKEAETAFTQKQNATDEEFQKAQEDAQKKMNSINQAYSTQLKQKLDVAVAGVVKDKGLDVVMDSAEMRKSVLQGGMDITDEVIQKLQ